VASPRWPSRRKGAELTPNEDELYDRHSEELQSSGAMVLAFAPEGISRATSLRGDIITDGPFLETKEVIVGFYVIEAYDLDEALAIARKNPIVKRGGGVEVRPITGGIVVGLASM
jgi:hypothetical protein